MRSIVWREAARANLAEMVAYISADNPAAARQLRDAIEESVLPLIEHPFLYKSGRARGTREIVVHPNYIVIYRVTTHEIEVVTVVHARRRYP